jgi:hypothetical protein
VNTQPLIRGSKRSRMPAPSFVIPHGFGERSPENSRTGRDTTRWIVARTEWHRIVRALKLKNGQTFAHLGSSDEAGLWIAQTTFSRLIGVERSPESVHDVAIWAEDFRLAFPPRFVIGEPGATRLPNASLDGAVCLDTQWLEPSATTPLREMARILRPGARLALCLKASENSHLCGLLPIAGFAIESCELLGEASSGGLFASSLSRQEPPRRLITGIRL